MSDESERVKKHNRSKMKQGYKNISFKVSPEEFKMIKKARNEQRMSTRELLVYFVSEQYIKEVFQSEYYDSFNSLRLSSDEYAQKEHDEFGRAHKFINKKEYVLAAYLSIDRKKIKVAKDFDSFEEAEEYYNSHNFKRRMAIFQKDEYTEQGWYTIRREW